MSDINFNITDDQAGDGGGVSQIIKNLIASDTLVSSQYPASTNVFSALTVTTTGADEEVPFFISATALGTSTPNDGGAWECFWGYKINGGSIVWLPNAKSNSGPAFCNSSTSFTIPFATADTYSVQIVATSSHNNTYTIQGNSTFRSEVFYISGYSIVSISSDEITTETFVTATPTISATYSANAWNGIAAVTGMSHTATVGSDGIAKFNFKSNVRLNAADLLYGYQIDSSNPVYLNSVFNGASITYVDCSFFIVIQGITPGSRVFKFCAAYSTGSAPTMPTGPISAVMQVTTNT